MHIDARFGFKILPIGVEIFKPSAALTLQAIRHNKYLCTVISINLGSIHAIA